MINKLEIPQVIRDAVHNTLAGYPVAANTGHAAEIACEAFARALKEHPIVPTTQWADRMISSWEVLNEKSLISAIEEWQRHIFDAPERELCPIEDALRKSGVIIHNDWLCPECEGVHAAIVPDSSCKIASSSARTGFNREPEAPEEIKDMLLDARAPDSEHCFFKPSVYNERIIEAYWCGRESKEP